MIKYFFRKLGSPPEEDCDRYYGTISQTRGMVGEGALGIATVQQALEKLINLNFGQSYAYAFARSPLSWLGRCFRGGAVSCGHSSHTAAHIPLG